MWGQIIGGGLQLGLAGVQALTSMQRQKQAEEAALAAKTSYMNIEKQNKLKALTAPDISSLQYEANQAASMQALDSLSSMGSEGAANVASLVAANRNANLQTAQSQANLDFQVDKAVLQQDQAIEDDRVQAERSMAAMELEGAQDAAAYYDEQKQSGIMGSVEGAGMLGTGLYGLYANENIDYGLDK